MIYTIQDQNLNNESLTNLKEKYLQLNLDMIYYEQEMFETFIQHDYVSTLNESFKIKFDFKAFLNAIKILFDKVIKFIQKKYQMFKIKCIQLLSQIEIAVSDLELYKNHIKVNKEATTSDGDKYIYATYLDPTGMNIANQMIREFNTYITNYYSKIINSFMYEFNNIGNPNKIDQPDNILEMDKVEDEIDEGIFKITVNQKDLTEYFKNMFTTMDRISSTDESIIIVMKCLKNDGPKILNEVNDLFKKQAAVMNSFKKTCDKMIVFYDNKQNKVMDPEFEFRLNNTADLLNRFSPFIADKSTYLQNAICDGILFGLTKTRNTYNEIKKKNPNASKIGNQYVKDNKYTPMYK